MAEPAWQELLRLRLVERNAKESAFSPVIEQCACMGPTHRPPLPFFPLYSSMVLPISARSSACTTNEAFEGEKRLAATRSRNRQAKSQQLDRLCPGVKRRVRPDQHF
jgi:hypothetical protein